MLKNLFITGLITVLPIAFTYSIIKIAIDFITNPFIEIYTTYLEPYIPTIIPEYIYDSVKFAMTLLIAKQIIILIIVFLVISAIGLAVKHVLSPSIKEIALHITNRLPFINMIYTTIKQVVITLFKKDSIVFNHVVMVPFNGGYTFGMVTGNPLGIDKDLCTSDGNNISDMVSVFIPTAPSPLSGFLLSYNKKDVIFIKIEKDDLFKHIVSLGLIHVKQS